jgi:hypothetical protein
MHDVRILTGEKHVAHCTHEWGCAHAHPEKAHAHIHRVQSLLKMAGVQVILAHHNGWDSKHQDVSAWKDQAHGLNTILSETGNSIDNIHG